MTKFKIQAIETNIDVYPPIFQHQIYEAVSETTSYYQGQPPSKKYVIEVEEYEPAYIYGVNSLVTKRYEVPGYLFKLLESDKPKCICGQEKTWQHYHRKSCPPNKHSDWCELYKDEKI
jgi:hypothetical protein